MHPAQDAAEIVVEHTFSSSNFFSLRFFLFRAVSSRRSASSESVRYFFFIEVVVGSTSNGDKRDSNQYHVSRDKTSTSDGEVIQTSVEVSDFSFGLC